MTENLIEVRNLKKQFPVKGGVFQRQVATVDAVDGVDVDIRSGEAVGLVGESGCGKTTLGRMLVRLLEPTSGEARVLGHDVRSDSQRVRELAGVLLESDGLYNRLTAMQNLDYYGRIAKLGSADRARRIRDLLEAMGLWERRDGRVADFSKGMRQKLALARAFLSRPKLLFLDEPTSGLDTPSAVALRRQLVDLARDEVETWDSMSVVAIAVGVDETFGYHMSPDEAMRVAGVRDIIGILEEKGISFAE